MKCFFVAFAVLACAASADAGVIAMPAAGPARVVGADAVIVGKVVGIEPMDVKSGTSTFRIAVVKITEGIRGVKEEKTLRIGFVPIPKPDNKGPLVISSGPKPIQLEPGQAGLFLLTKQAKGDFYTIGGVVGYYLNSDSNKDFDKEVQIAKDSVKVMENPKAALKSKDAGARLLAASILIEQYRSFAGGPKIQPMDQPIDADESKLIMKALAEADWQTPWNFALLRPIPAQLFQRLGVTANDGFAAPAGGNFPAAAEKWVRENSDTYRIKRLVPKPK